MCGFLAIYNKSNRLYYKDIELSLSKMQHRGPDDSGIWIDKKSNIALGHRRLSIVDLSHLGHQPMFNNEHNCGIVFNGEIYNHLDLRRELSNFWTFNSQSDTETILASYCRWGFDCVARLEGMFSFVIYDKKRNLFFCARDRAGEKPFFYKIDDEGFQAASELKSLLSFSSYKNNLDPHAFAYYLSYGYIPGAKCIIKGFKKLPAAHALVYNLDSKIFDIFPYWNLPSSSPIYDENQLILEFESIFMRSVASQLEADVPVGVLLSGGVDSSLVTAVASRVSSKKIRTFTAGFPGHDVYDERSYARIVADYFNTEHLEISIEPSSVAILPELARQFDEPMCDSSMVPTYLISKAIRQHCTVALGGDGADELFGGYPTYQWARKQLFLRQMLPFSVRSLISYISRNHLPIGFRGRNYLNGLSGNLDDALASNFLLFDLDFCHLLSPLIRDAKIQKNKISFKSNRLQLERGFPGALMAMDFHSYLVEDILVKIDRASMLSSLEMRSPFLNHKIIEFAFSKVPNSLRINKTSRKILLKKISKEILPAELNIDRKQGFSIPFKSWFSESWGVYMEDVLREAPENLFDKRIINSLFEDQKKGKSNTERIFGLTMFELWRQHYLN